MLYSLENCDKAEAARRSLAWISTFRDRLRRRQNEPEAAVTYIHGAWSYDKRPRCWDKADKRQQSRRRAGDSVFAAVNVARNSVGNERASRGRQEPNREIRATGESETERGLSLGDKLLPKRTNKIIRYGECDAETREVYEEIEEYVRTVFFLSFIINFLSVSSEYLAILSIFFYSWITLSSKKVKWKI